MGFFSKKKEEIKPRLMETPEQASAKKLLSSYFTKYGEGLPSPYEPYGGRLSADMPSSYEEIDPILSQYLSQGQNRLMGLSEEEISKTLSGEYDPYASPYYKSLRKGLDIEKERGMTSLRQSAQGAGMYDSLGRLIDEARLTGQDVGAAGDILAGLQWKERQNRLGVLPQAMGLGEYQEAAPTRRLSAIAGYGGIPAGYEQADLDRMYQEFTRQKQEQKYPLSLAQNFLSSYNPSYMYPQYSTQGSGFSSMLGGAGAGAQIGSMFGPWGTAIGAVGGGLMGAFNR